MPKKPSNEIQITRVYDAPVKAVWDAWTDTKQVAKWWGPRGFTITTHSKDLRPGGTWDYIMHGPDGTNWDNVTKYHEVVQYKRLVYDHGGSKDRPPLFRVEVDFKEKNGKTTMDMKMILASPEAAEQIKKHIKQAGGNATWDRLAEFLDEETLSKKTFVINRTFDAPLATVFKMWSDPEHLTQWLPPTGLNMQFISGEIKVGTTTMYAMGNHEFTMYGKSTYKEISAPHRLSFIQQFCDQKGNMARHPGAPVWPETWLTTVTLAEEGPDLTRVTVTSEVCGNFSAEELQAFIEERGGMTQGWTGSFDKLEDYLKA